MTGSKLSGDWVTVCDDVHDFTLEYIREAQPLTNTPRVLLVVSDAGALDVDDTAKQALIESWGFSVQLIGGDATQMAFDTFIGDADVLYISESTPSTAMLGKDFNPPIGVVNEEQNLYDEYGLAEGTHAYVTSDDMWIVNDAHEITAGLGAGSVVIHDFPQEQVSTQGALAPGAAVITQSSGSYVTTVAVDAGGELYGGGRALRRRVGLVWGTNSFDFSLVNDTGRQYMRQAIVWASAPAAIGAVRITLQIGSDPNDRVEAEIQLLNKPGEP